MNWRTLWHKLSIEFSRNPVCQFVIASKNLPHSTLKYWNILIKFGRDPACGIYKSIHFPVQPRMTTEIQISL